MSKNDSRISPIEVKPENRLRILTDRDLEDIHQATLAVLKETGVKFPSPKALEIFADAGAKVDFDEQIVKLPPDMVLDALDKAPRTYTLASRGDSQLDLKLDGTKTYFATDGTGTTTIDLETRQRRPSKQKDIAMMMKVADYLPSISYQWVMVSAQDKPSSTATLHELEAAFANTEKHVQTETVMGEKSASYAVEIASLVAGGRDKLRKSPPLSSLVCTVDPLAQDKDGIEGALTFAKAGIPVGFMAMPTLGSTAPISLAGTMVVGNAEVISALTLIQLKHPGAPVYYSLLPGVLNPHTGGYLAGVPQKHLLNAAGVQLGHYYDIPVLSGGCGGVDAHQPGVWQAGKETSSDPLPVALCGADMGAAIGLLEASTLLYPEKILFDDEILETVKVFAEGIEVNSETLAVDEIMDVGPRGHFLTSESTQRNLQKIWNPGITHQWSPEKRDFKDPQEAAKEKIEWILDNHEPKPLDQKVREEIKGVIDKAEEQLSKTE